jgi:predicted metalloprotease with PDZ domain
VSRLRSRIGVSLWRDRTRRAVASFAWLVALASALGPLRAAAQSSPDADAVGWRPRDLAYPGHITLDVDATDVQRGIFRVRETIPVAHAGRFTLLFPKWVPGNHAPTARIERLAGLLVSAGGRRLHWSRDPVDMHAFHVEVPNGVRMLDVRFDYLSATNGVEGRVVMTPEMLNLQWFSLVLYPSGHFARRIRVEPRVTLPDGWQLTTQMEIASRSGAVTRFAPVSLEMLLDSPIFAGRHFRRFALGEFDGAPAFLDVVADSARQLDASRDAIDVHGRLVAEAVASFGALPLRRYTFMLALTRELGSIGTEHLASSENTRPPDYLSDWQWSALLAHELTHAWNGKARRPRDLWSPDFNVPMRNSMLWLYEGQTQFWGFVLAARSGLMTREQVLDVFARLAARQSVQPGRRWRPLGDTGNDAIMTRELFDEPWPSWHRSLDDSYLEADLVWLEADGLIRELSGETRSLDDFARNFFGDGGERTPAPPHSERSAQRALAPRHSERSAQRAVEESASLYDRNDVVAALRKVQQHDWAAFLATRLDSVAPSAPSDWLRRSGYRLVFTDSPSEAYAAHHRRTNRLDLSYSLGLVLRGGSAGDITEVVWDSPAFEAGLVAGATILAVNDVVYEPATLLEAIRQNGGGGTAIRLRVRNRDRERTVSIDYRGGLRFPRLERVSGVPDRLGMLLRPRAAVEQSSAPR